MDDEQLARIIGNNITRLRKAANMTQLELAEKLNYSDKSVSKWEQGNGTPDVRILMQIATLFGVTLDELTSDIPGRKLMPKTMKLIHRCIVMLLSAGIVWLIAAISYALIWIFAPELPAFSWLAFLYAVPISSIVVFVFACVWKYKWLKFSAITVIIWTVLTCIFLTAYAFGANIWVVYIIGIPLEALAVVFFLFWRKIRSLRN